VGDDDDDQGGDEGMSGEGWMMVMKMDGDDGREREIGVRL